MLLFYNQIKREFSRISWKRGQTYFREERVKDVRVDGDLIVAKVKGSDRTAYDTAIVTARGKILNSKCSCPAHRLYETHCKHVAALSIWIVERGSLLRSGVMDTGHGIADEEGEEVLVLREPEKAAADVRLRKLMLAHPELATAILILRRNRTAASIEGRGSDGRGFVIPITPVEAIALQEHGAVNNLSEALPEPNPGEAVYFVKGIFQNRALAAITIEPAARYVDPDTGQVQVITSTYLRRSSEPGVWQNMQGVRLKLLPQLGENGDPVIELNTAKIFHQGAAALETLAALLMHPFRNRYVFDRTLDVEVDPQPLSLVSMTIGSKGDKHRTLTYEFKNHAAAFSSEELDELSKEGKLSNKYVWRGNRLYKFETSLTRLSQYTNRSGVAASEHEGEEDVGRVNPFGSLVDDGQHPLHPMAAYRLSLELGVERFFVDPQWEEFHEWRENFEKKTIPALPKVSYGFDLREYQTNGLKWLWSLYHRGLSALLADDMGLGKTHQVLALLSSLYAGRASPNKPKLPTLVVAPTSVVSAWAQKLNKYDTGLKWMIFHGKDRKLPKTGIHLILTTYGILQREAVLRDREWALVILDEAQAIKNATTISARASRALKAKYRIAMTGTPVENSSTDLWSLMEFLLPGYLGALPRFKRLYGSGREAPNPAQARALRRLCSPFLLRRTKAQVLTELPEKTEEVVSCELTPAQRKIYRAYLTSGEGARIRESLEGSGKIDYAGVLALLTRLKQVCDHPRLADLTSGKVKHVKTLKTEDSGKWVAFEELLDEALGSGLKIVVFTQYLGMMDLVAHSLKIRNIGYTELRGDTIDRTATLERFASDPECKVFVCSLLAGGLGIDLTAGSVCIHLDRWWNPAKENQATDRLHRIGQTRGVQVFKLQIPGTVEDRIAQIIESKVALSGALIEESPLGLKAFSRKELLDLLAPPPSD